jgi:RNA polymerase sigma factor (sigma-70 family)
MAPEQWVRELAPQVLGAVMRRYRDFSASEDAVQEALLAAAEQWPKSGMPTNPRGWLIQVASRKVVDHVRAEAARRHRESLVVSLVPLDEQIALGADQEASPERDDSLELLFLCCHPVLSDTSAIALTLRAIGGLTTAEIARAFLVPEATMAQRISRAKESIRGAQHPLSASTHEDFARRLALVKHVLYLIFNEGYATSGGPELLRVDLSSEALRLTRLLLRLVPEEPEVLGLLALMRLTDARRSARTGPRGELIPLDEQDRSHWDQSAIAEGVELVTRAFARGAPGPYQVQAAIAALHDEARTAAETDWPQILALYGVLENLADNPMVRLNQAIALAMVHGPRAGLERLASLEADPRLRSHHRLEAARAHLLERAGELHLAAECYQRAAERTASSAERDYLRLRSARSREAHELEVAAPCPSAGRSDLIS